MTEEQLVLGDHVFRYDGTAAVKVLNGDAWVSVDDLLAPLPLNEPRFANGAWLGCLLLGLVMTVGFIAGWAGHHWVVVCP